MLVWLALLVGAAHAEEYYLEGPSVSDRAVATRMEQAADAAGFAARTVRRFRLGKGWEYVVIVEGLADAGTAATASARLERELGGRVQAWRVDGKERAVAVNLPAPALPTGDGSAAAWMERARLAHGGPSGGASALARAGAVHFRFARTFDLGGKRVTVRHDYWREGGSRRLAVETGGAAKDSVAVATSTAAWLRAGGQVLTRDIGITIGMIDAFAPEAVLTVALEAARLLEAPEVASFRALEGAESGLRFGAGGDESEPGLSFVDVDPATGQLLRARYVSEAGPLTFELSGWRQVASGVFVPADVTVERPDGQRETIRVEGLELLDRAPASTFVKPA